MLDSALFGKKVREGRKAQGLTQDGVGRALGVSADKLLGIDVVGIESLCQELERHIHQRRAGSGKNS